MACTLMGFRYATEELSKIIHRTVSHESLWYNVPKKGPLQLGQGTQFVNFGFGNIEPYTACTGWSTVTLSPNQTEGTIDTDAEFCGDSWSDVASGWIELAYKPEMSLLRGEVICEKQLLFAHNIDGFIRAYIEEMTKRARRQWETLYAYHHRKNSTKVIIVTDIEGSFYEQEAFTGLPAATGSLTQEVLDYCAMWLMENGAQKPDDNGYITIADNDPIFTLGINAMASLQLLRLNSDLRRDFRYADPNMLVARLGSSRIIGNFRHMIDQLSPRYTWAGNTYTEVPPFAADTDVDSKSDQDSVATGSTSMSKINPDWRVAPYEGYDVLCPTLFESLVPNAVHSAGGVSVGFADYMGEWNFVTGAYKWGVDSEQTNCASTYGDPLDERGRHFARFLQAASVNPMSRFKHALHIIGKRCLNNKVTITTCSS